MPLGGIVVFDGDSLTAGQGSTGAGDYPSQVMVALAAYGVYAKYNFGVGGQTTTQMIADAPTQIDPLWSASNAQSVVCAQEITNELYHGVLPATAYANIVQYCQARRAAHFQVIVLTVLPRSNVGTPADFEANRQTVNALIRANWPTFCDKMADIAADSRIGNAGSQLDTTYYDVDEVHLNNAGYGVMAAIVAATIQGLLSVTTLVLQPDGTAHNSITIVNLTGNQAGAVNFDIGLNPSGNLRHGIMLYDLSSIPSNATINSATLSLWLSTNGSTFSSNNLTISAYRIRAGRDWVEAQATYAIFKTANNWTTPGCQSTASDREAVAIGSAALTTSMTSGTQVDFVLTPGAGGVKDWVDGTLVNYGMVFIGSTEVDGSLYRFHSPYGATANLRPMLTVVYTTGAGHISLSLSGVG